MRKYFPSNWFWVIAVVFLMGYNWIRVDTMNLFHILKMSPLPEDTTGQMTFVMYALGIVGLFFAYLAKTKQDEILVRHNTLPTVIFLIITVTILCLQTSTLCPQRLNYWSADFGDGHSSISWDGKEFLALYDGKELSRFSAKGYNGEYPPILSHFGGDTFLTIPMHPAEWDLGVFDSYSISPPEEIVTKQTRKVAFMVVKCKVYLPVFYEDWEEAQEKYMAI